MEKIVKKAILGILIAALAATGLTACKEKNNQNSVSGSSLNSENDPVEYYGCPNSNRIRKLNLKKKKIK